MAHTLKVLIMGKLCFILSTAVLFAAVGTLGSNGQVPYLTLSHKYAGEEVTIQLHDAAPDHGTILYLFSLEEGYQDWTKYYGNGGIIIPKDGLMMFSGDEILVMTPPVEFIGETVYVQAIIQEKSPTVHGKPITLSRPYQICFSEKYDVPNLQIDVLSHVPHAGKLMDVAEYGSHIYAASHPFGLVKFKNNPGKSPDLLDVVQGGNFSFPPERLAVNGQRAVLVTGNGFVGVAEISNPYAAPQYMGEIYLSGYSFGKGVVQTVGAKTYAFLNAWSNGVITVDVTNPSTFGMLNKFLSGECVVSVNEQNGYMYALTYSGKGFVYDLGKGPDPAAMLVAQFSIPAAPQTMAFGGDHAYVLSMDGQEAFVYAIPSTYGGSAKPAYKKTVSLGSKSYLNIVAVDGNAFLHDDKAVQHFEIDATQSFTANGSLYFSEDVTDISIGSSVIHVARSGYGRGFETVEIPTMQKLALPDYSLSHLDVVDMAIVDVDVDGYDYRFVYVAENNVGLRVVDASDPKNPTQVNTIPGSVQNVVNYGENIIYSLQPNIVKICAIDSAEGDLLELGSFQADAWIPRLCVSGEYLFVAECLEGMSIYHLGDHPENPELTAKFKDSSVGPVFNLTVGGYFAYLFGTKGMSILDISDRKSPELIGGPYSGFGSKSLHCAADGFLLFIPNWDEGLEIFDTFAPYSSQGIYLRDNFILKNIASDVAFAGNVAITGMEYLGGANNNKYMLFYDITNPDNINCFHKVYDLPGMNACVEVKDGLIYASDEESLLDILSLK